MHDQVTFAIWNYDKARFFYKSVQNINFKQKDFMT